MPVVIIGVGNTCRGDDAAGITVARRIRAKDLAGVTVVEADGEGTALMEMWRHAEAVILIDAVCSHAPPGTLHRFDVHKEVLPSVFFRCSTHTFSVAAAVALARTLGWLPPVFLMYGIEGACYETGAALSPNVERAVVRLVEQISTEARTSCAHRVRRPAGGEQDRTLPGREPQQEDVGDLRAGGTWF